MPTRGSFQKRGKFNKNFNKRKHSSNTYNKPKSKHNFKKRKFDDNAEKLEKIEKNNIVPQDPVSSSDESDIVEDPLKQLLDTFDVDHNKTNKKLSAIETDSENESEIEDSENDVSDALDNVDEDVEDIDDLDNVDGDAEDLDDVDEDAEDLDDVDEDIENNVDDDEDVGKDSSEEETEELDVKEDDNLTQNDPFVKHLSYDLSENFVETLQNVPIKTSQTILEWPWLGKLSLSIPKCEATTDKNFTLGEDKKYASEGIPPSRLIPKNINLTDLHIKSQIHKNIKPANQCLDEDDKGTFTEFQSELFSILNNYQDLYYTDRTFENADEIRFIYCLHAINHVLKTRTKVLHHNARLQKKSDVPEEFRDQGLVRPKVLIIVPFRDSALKIVENLIALLVPQEAGQVINKNRFIEDFTGNELALPKKNPKPEDYELTFTGNCDDTFKIGIQVTKKSLKLYADFYNSDIIIASPLGLRLTVGAEGEAERDHDFLASIELLILDQTELFLMQNWDHVVHVLDHLHVQPKQSHGTDFARVRTWSLNGWSRYYRQSLIFSSLQLPEINAIFNRKCCNYSGALRTCNPIANGSIVNVHVQLPQIYKRFICDDVCKAIDARFEFFLSKILPQYRDTIMKQCLIYVPSYFDYVKIRNHFKREDIGFVQICEYSKDAKIARARDMFFHGDAHFLLYSERFHYFRRIRLKGIRHVIFYQPPTFPHFYSEICNFMQEANQNKKCGSISNMTVTVIYSKYDYQRMAPILGTERLTKVATSNNNFHMFTSSDR